MRASRFVGATLLEAVRSAKAALGPEVLIVAARRVSRRGWLRRSRENTFEVTALERDLPAAADGVSAALPDLRALGARVEALAAALEQTSQLADEVGALRRAVELLATRTAAEPGSSPVRSRIARVRIAPDGAPRTPDSTPRSVDSWNRN